MPINWIDMKPVEEFVTGGPDYDHLYNNAIQTVQQIAEMVLYKKFPGCRSSDEKDLISVAVVHTMEKLQEPFVDFTKGSAFNFVFTRCRNAMTNYSRKIPRYEIRETDMTGYTFTHSHTNVRIHSTIPRPESHLVDYAFQSEYDRLHTRMKIFGLDALSCEEAVLQGCDFKEEHTTTRDVLLVASFRTLFPREIREI